MKVEIDPEDIVLAAFTKPCPNSAPEMKEGKKGHLFLPDPTCYWHKRCGKCFDGKILSKTGEQFAKMIHQFKEE